jgi:hypothetical protein
MRPSPLLYDDASKEAITLPPLYALTAYVFGGESPHPDRTSSASTAIPATMDFMNLTI